MKRYLLSRVTAALLGAALLVSACGDGTDDTATPETTPQEPVSTTTTPATTATSTGDSSTTDAPEATMWPHDWTAELVGGGQFDASDYEGQDLVLWFWTPW